MTPAATMPAHAWDESTAPVPAMSRAGQAIARLQASRQRLATQWMPPPDDSATSAHGQAGTRWGAWWRLARRQLTKHPIAAELLGVVRSAWQRHPLRPAAQILAGEVRGTFVPTIRRHPLASIGIAAALAAAVVAVRPWRMPWIADAWRPWPARWRRWAWSQLTQLPIQTLLASWWLASHTPSPSTAQAHDRPATDAAPTPDGASHGT